MGILKHRKLALVTALSVAISACGSEETQEEPRVNANPTVSIKGEALINEGESRSFTLNAIDDVQSYDALKIELITNEAKGSVRLDKAAKRVIYDAAWITDVKSVQDSFEIKVTDADGGITTVRQEINVIDLNEPVNVLLTPPSQAFGYENTSTDSEMTMWIMEGEEPAVFRYAITENDGDELTVDYDISSPFFRNNITPVMSDTGEEMSIALTIPQIINVPSQTFDLSVTVEDNDAPAAILAHVVIVNQVSLNWLPGDATSLSEATGGEFKFSSSEDGDYPGNYVVELSIDGEPLDFNLPYRLDASSGLIVFGASEGFLGDQPLNVKITLSNEIQSGGDSYLSSTVLEKTVILEDDRDDDFTVYNNAFEKQITWFQSVKLRRDESRIAQIVTQYWMMNEWVTLKEKKNIIVEIARLLEVEYASIEADIVLINQQLGNTLTPELQVLLDDFSIAIYDLGNAAKDHLQDQHDQLVASDPERTMGTGPLLRGGEAKEIGETLTQYIGNQGYGYFEDDNTRWVFLPEYAYLDTVNVLDPTCL
jgi:hypothetical protein